MHGWLLLGIIVTVMVAIRLFSNPIIFSAFISWFCIAGQSFLFFLISLCVDYVIGLNSCFAFSLRPFLVNRTFAEISAVFFLRTPAVSCRDPDWYYNCHRKWPQETGSKWDAGLEVHVYLMSVWIKSLPREIEYQEPVSSRDKGHPSS